VNLAGAAAETKPYAGNSSFPEIRCGTNETAAGAGLKQPGAIFAGMGTGRAEEAAMFRRVKVAIRRSQERARHRRNYRALLQLEDAFLRDIGLDRDEVRGRMSSDRFA
jgi:uncharacterized protein YjiS (DUF1127 family)